MYLWPSSHFYIITGIVGELLKLTAIQLQLANEDCMLESELKNSTKEGALG